jgi:surface polysaccharide O-acyltransferase-like enzyme
MAQYLIWLDNARIISIFAVIFLHVSAGVLLNNQTFTKEWWIGNIYDSMVRWCVPVFVMISGALMLNPRKSERIVVFYRKRMSRIFIPMIVWSFFYVLWTYFHNLIKNGNIHTSINLIKMFLSGQFYYHMWFLYMIAGLYFFTPFFRKIVKHSTNKELLFLVTVIFILSAINNFYTSRYPSNEPVLFVNYFIFYIPYYLCGYIICNINISLPKLILLIAILLSIIFTCIGCFALVKFFNTQPGFYFYDNLSITVIPMSIFVILLLKKLSNPIFDVDMTKRISGLTLGIYLVHPAIKETFAFLGFKATFFNPVVSIPIYSLILFAISLCVAWIINKIPYLRQII